MLGAAAPLPISPPCCGEHQRQAPQAGREASPSVPLHGASEKPHFSWAAHPKRWADLELAVHHTPIPGSTGHHRGLCPLSRLARLILVPQNTDAPFASVYAATVATPGPSPIARALTHVCLCTRKLWPRPSCLGCQVPGRAEGCAWECRWAQGS